MGKLLNSSLDDRCSSVLSAASSCRFFSCGLGSEWLFFGASGFVGERLKGAFDFSSGFWAAGFLGAELFDAGVGDRNAGDDGLVESGADDDGFADDGIDGAKEPLADFALEEPLRDFALHVAGEGFNVTAFRFGDFCSRFDCP